MPTCGIRSITPRSVSLEKNHCARGTLQLSRGYLLSRSEEMNMRKGILLSLTIVILAAVCFAQMETATVSGRVLDKSAAAVVGAEVVLTNVDTGAQNQMKTGKEGLYVFTGVMPGRYRLAAGAAGFSVTVKNDLIVHVQDELAENFTLQVGSVNEVVTVSASAVNINTTDASVSTVVDQTYLQNMPLNGRSFQDLILLTPGTVTQTPQGNGYGFPGASGEFSVNGQRTEENYYSVDGVSANVGANGLAGLQSAGPSGSVAASTALGTTQALVSVDDLQEFRVQSSSYSAEYGRNPGGQLSFETKSGTNQFHGTAYDYLRNDLFDANDWFNDYFAVKEPPLRQNDFGGTLGGPVRVPGLYNGKDKTFFFVSYEGLRLLQPQAASVSNVPDLCLRGTGNCPAGLVPAPSALQPVMKAWPAPNGGEILIPCGQPSDPGCDPLTGLEPSGAAKFIGAWSNPSSINSTSVRLDHVVMDKLRLFFRFSDTSSSSATRQGLSFSPSADEVSSNTMRTYTAGATSLLTNRVSNDVRLNYSSNFGSFRQFIDAFGGNTPVDLGQLSGTGAGSGATINLRLGPSTGNPFQGPAAFLEQIPISTAQRQWNLVDTVSLSLGRHQFKFGVDYRRLTPFGIPARTFIGYTYLGASSVASNSAGIFASASAPGYPLYTNFSAFVDDDWRTSSRLALSMGLRWDVNPPPGVTQGMNAYTVEGTVPDNWSLAPQGTPLWKTTWFNFAPRLGAAYVVRDKQGWATVIRAGGGLFFDTGQQLASLGFVFGPGFQAFGGGSGPFPASASLIPTITNPPQPGTYTPYGFAPHLQLPYTIHWNASVQQALGASQALTLSYVDSHAARLLQQDTYQTPNNVNGIGSFSFVQNGLTSDYDSAQVQFQRRLNRGLTILASYTWAHCLDYGSQNFNLGYQRGNCDFDIRQNLSAAFSYDAPNVGHGALVSAFLNHWGIDNRFTARTGFPVTLTSQNYAFFGLPFLGPNGRVFDQGLDLTGKPVYIYGAQCQATYNTDFGVNLPCPGGRAINPDAFVPVPLDPNTGLPDRLGTAPRNFARGFGAWQLDTAIRRDFPITERLKLQFRAEAFNVFNHPNFGFVDPILGDPTFGQTTNTLATSPGILSSLYQMGGPRSMQFALKIVF